MGEEEGESDPYFVLNLKQEMYKHKFQRDSFVLFPSLNQFPPNLQARDVIKLEKPKFLFQFCSCLKSLTMFLLYKDDNYEGRDICMENIN